MTIKLTKLTSLPGRPLGCLHSIEGKTSGIIKDYWIKGVPIGKPQVGERFVVIRSERNGIKVVGIFETSPVAAIEFENAQSMTFKTQNSIYQMDVL